MKKYFVAGLLLAAFTVLPSVASAQSIAELQAKIAVLMEQIRILQGQTGTGSQQWCHTFNQNLGVGTNNDEVSYLNGALMRSGLIVAGERNGIKSNENIYDEITAALVSRFQQKYVDEILTPNGLSAPTGYFGPATRAKMNSLYGCRKIIDDGLTIKPKPVISKDQDLNSDGEVNKYDANYLANVIFGTSYCPANKNCDLNKDGYINVFDLSEFPFVGVPVDLNSDGRIDFYDRNLLTNVIFGTSVCPQNVSCDINRDGYVNVFDLVAVTVNQPGNKPPSISGTEGPTALKIGETGTWSVRASDPENGPLSYSVIWGDASQNNLGTNESGIPAPQTFTQTATFTHVYNQAGNFYPQFFVKDNGGGNAGTGISVNVVIDDTVANAPHIDSITPISGPVGTTVEIRGSNLSGLGGELIAVFKRADGKIVNIHSIVPYSTVDANGYTIGSVNTTLIKVKVEPPCQRGQTVYGDYTGIPSVCDYFEFTPGVYKIYVTPWGKKSNEVQFTVI